MAIGFGQYLTAAVFLIACFLILLSGQLITKYWMQNLSKTLEIRLITSDLNLNENLYENLKQICINVKHKQSRFQKLEATMIYDVVIKKGELNNLNAFLLSRDEISEFNY